MADIETRSRGISVKSTDDESGAFEAIVSAFGNEDSYGDVMVPGAFARTLAEWKDDGGELPFLWSHASYDPMAYVAGIHEATETDEGLRIKGKFDLDTDQSRQAYKLLKSRRVKEFSFGFIVRDAEDGEKDGRPVRYVKDVDLLEASMTILGANPATRLVAIKSAPKTPDSGTLSPDDVVALMKRALAEDRAEQKARADDKKQVDTAAANDDDAPDEAVHDGKSGDQLDVAAAIGQLGTSFEDMKGLMNHV